MLFTTHGSPLLVESAFSRHGSATDVISRGPESPPAPSEPAVDENDERRAATEAELRLTRTLEAAGLL